MLEDRFEYNHRIDRFKKNNVITEKVNRIEMDFAMKSIDIKDIEFINKVRSEASDQYKFMKNLYYEYKNGSNILKYFIADDINIEIDNTKKLKKILAYNLQIKDENKINIKNILKFKLNNKNENAKIRLYIENINSEYKVLLIDLFHLAIPSKHCGISANEMMSKTYKKYCNNKMSICKIKQQFKLSNKT